MKKFFIITMGLVILGSLSYSSILTHSMYEKYNETIKWENSSLLSKIHQVPPSLAQNYISIEEQKLFQILTDVNIALEEIKKNGEVKDKKYNEYWDLHEKAKSEIKSSNVYDTLPVKDIFNDFNLYLEADLAIKKAYDNLDVENLDGYAKTFSTRLSKEDSEIDRSFLNELNKISNDYKELNDFSKNALSKLGIIENNILHVDIKVNKEITGDLIKEINDKKLTRFSHIKDLVDSLNGDSWSKILAHNSSSLEYYSWKESQKILDGLLYSNYIAVSSFNDVQDVLAYDPSISLEEKENFTINEDSVVTGVYYNEEKLSEDLYIKKGASLNFTIDYEYTESPKSTITVEYVDIDGNTLDNVNEKSYTEYVGSSIEVDRKEIDGYTFIRVENDLDEFPGSDSIIKIVYEKDEPEEDNEDLNEDEDLEHNESSNETDDLESNSDDLENNVEKENDDLENDNI